MHQSSTNTHNYTAAATFTYEKKDLPTGPIPIQTAKEIT
jgi:hypothetical protein